MGNWGGAVAARTDGDLRDLMEAAGFDEVEDPEVLEDGWQVAEFADAPERALAALVGGTGTPALMVSLMDSDVGLVKGVTHEGHVWEGLLDRETAESYEIPLEEFPVERAVAGALAWSAAAGLTADAAVVERALTGSTLFAEELVSLLYVGLGIPGAESAASEEDDA
jgi:hypothetical protein